MILNTARMRSKQNTSIIAMVCAFNQNIDMKQTYYFILTTCDFQPDITLIAKV